MCTVHDVYINPSNPKMLIWKLISVQQWALAAENVSRSLYCSGHSGGRCKHLYASVHIWRHMKNIFFVLVHGTSSHCNSFNAMYLRDSCRCRYKALYNRSKSRRKVKWLIKRTKQGKTRFRNQETNQAHNQITNHKEQGLVCQETRLHWAIHQVGGVLKCA